MKAETERKSLYRGGTGSFRSTGEKPPGFWVYLCRVISGQIRGGQLIGLLESTCYSISCPSRDWPSGHGAIVGHCNSLGHAPSC